MSAGPFLADRLITWFWPWGRKKLDNLPHRRQIFLWLIIIGVFWAGFSAWREERDRRLAAESYRDQAQKESASQSTQMTLDVKQLRQQLADQSTQTQQLQHDLSAAETQIHRLSSMNNDLNNQLNYLTSDRHLTPADINKFANFLRLYNSTPHTITIGDLSMGCADCGIYADDFISAFKLAGWNTQKVNYADLNPAIKGIFIAVHDRSNPPQDAIVVKNALDNTDIRNDGINTWDYVKGNDVELIVMPKP